MCWAEMIRRLVILAIVAASATAHAERVAVEAYVGNRPRDAERVLQPVRPYLERHGFVVDPAALANRFAAQTWRLGGTRAAGPQIFKAIENGIRQFEDAKLESAKALKEAIALARANPIAWANEPKYRDQVRRGILYFALALNFNAKNERDEASRATGRAQKERATKNAVAFETQRDEVLAELIRSFPAFVVNAKEYGPEAESLFLQARKHAEQGGRGSLELDVDDPNVVVYVDEVVQPRKITIGDLVPGTYRVLVVSATESHEYSVSVLGHRRSRIVVRWDLDSALRLNTWIGFEYRSETERQRERELLSTLVGPSGGVDVATTLTVTSTGRSAIVARSYDMRKGKTRATCTLERASRSDANALERFAQCLAGVAEPPSSRLVARPVTPSTPRTVDPLVVTHPEQVEPSEVADEAPGDDEADMDVSGSSRGWMKWAAIAAFGGAAIGGGLGVKFAMDGRAAGDELDRVCAEMCTSQQAKSLIDKQEIANRRAWISAGASGAVAVGGAVLLVLWFRDRGSTATPTAQLAPGRVTVGWSMSF